MFLYKFFLQYKMLPAFVTATSRKNSDFINFATYFTQWCLKNAYRKLYSDKFHIIPCDIKFYVSLFQNNA